MTLPSSGTISLNDIQNEFGGTNPIGLDEYYGVDTGVPTSGTIGLADFYGKSAGADVTPDSVDWGTTLGPGNDTSPSRTITGIDTTITLRINATAASVPGASIRAFVNGSQVASTFVGSSTTFNVSNNDNVYFTYLDPNSGVNTLFGGSITIENASDSDSTLHTFGLSYRSEGLGV